MSSSATFGQRRGESENQGNGSPFRSWMSADEFSSLVKANMIQGNGRAAERGAAAPAVALPCLSSNICTKAEDEKLNVLTGAHKRTAFIVALEIQRMVEHFGIERIGFFTLTFKDHVTDLREAQKRFHSLRTHVIAKRYKCAIGVWERQLSGRIHFHLVVVLDKDIRSGTDFGAFERKNYRSANTALRSEWTFWRETCPKYRFGRHELLPIKSNAEGIARYVGKYISKHINQRRSEDKGARVVRFIGFKRGMRCANRKFSWNTTNGWLWRHKTKAFAQRFGITGIEQMKMFFGSRWAYHLQYQILAERLDGVVFPSRDVALSSLNQSLSILMLQSRAREVLEKIEATQTRLLTEEIYDKDKPVWAVPSWFGQEPQKIPMTTEVLQEADENYHKMKDYVRQMPQWSEPRQKFKSWIEESSVEN